MPRVSVIIPTYNETPNLLELHRRLAAVMAGLPQYEWEVIFVDDGSEDGTTAVLEPLHRQDDRIKLVQFARNFGSHAALTAGLDYSSGDAAIVLTADLQEPPELIPQFLDQWRAGYEIVWGTRAGRADRAGGRLFSRFYARMFQRYARLPSYPSTTPAGIFLLDRRAVDAYRRFGERNRMAMALIAWTGLRYAVLPYAQEPRKAGRSGWSAHKKIKLTIDSVVAFSDAPLRWLVVAAAALVVAATIVAMLGWTGTIWASPQMSSSWLVAVMLLTSAMQLAGLAIIGQYLWRALDEARGRPLYIVRRTVGLDSRSRR